jgi:aldehyde:ferredoxin oxidoreductase
MQVKGLEAGMHDPRASSGLGLGYMVNFHGADHCSTILDLFFLAGPMITNIHHLGIYEPMPADEISPRKAAVSRTVMLKKVIDDCSVVCAVFEYSLDKQAEMIAAATGWDTGPVDLMKVAERVTNLGRLFNIREGFTAADDTLPERFFQPKTDGVLANITFNRPDMEKAKVSYYKLMGWDEKGVPLPEKLAELSIE